MEETCWRKFDLDFIKKEIEGYKEREQDNTAFITEDYKAKMMWFAASSYRQIQTDINRLSSSGVRIKALDDHLKGMEKTFRFAAECEDGDPILQRLKEFGATFIPYEGMMDLICRYIQKEKQNKQAN